jgi:hypothetical protein
LPRGIGEQHCPEDFVGCSSDKEKITPWLMRRSRRMIAAKEKRQRMDKDLNNLLP